MAAFLCFEIPLFANPSSDWASNWLVRQILVREYSAPLHPLKGDDDKINEYRSSTLAKVAIARVHLSLEQAKPYFVSSLSDEIKNEIAPIRQKNDFSSWVKTAFTNEQDRKSITAFLQANADLQCKVTPLEVKQYINHQKNVVSESQHAYSPDLIKYVKLWKKDRIKCLIMNLAKKFAADKEYDYLALAATLHQFGYSDDPFFKKMLAARYILERNYAEALRNIYELQAGDERFRVLYNLVQRQYSFVQKGKGEVSIKSL